MPRVLPGTSQREGAKISGEKRIFGKNLGCRRFWGRYGTGFANGGTILWRARGYLIFRACARSNYVKKK